MPYSVVHAYQTIDKEMDGKEPLTLSIKPEFLYLILTILSGSVIGLPLLPKTKVDLTSWIEEANQELETASPTAAMLIAHKLSELYRDS